ncbi:hypothetical protein GOP47_0000927 [Adiantum capillus-veneris]|uniref:Uncharacterized protein n=1 Tax=Adiantum capillus-veneris TaxID=13818 RepID=A0A9D4ZR66_ADICA|nr:hypothetical protein GOP47_0000927 [Adiantum capillus-veneris]
MSSSISIQVEVDIPPLAFQAPPQFLDRKSSFSSLVKQVAHALTVHTSSFGRPTVPASVIDMTPSNIHHRCSAPSAATSTSSTSSKLSRTRSSATYALDGLRFISTANAANSDKACEIVAKRFDQLADAHGMLSRSNFAQCIGMKESKEFALELFDALCRRHDQSLQGNLNYDHGISKADFHDMWKRISNPNFDSRMRIFFDMCDKNGDGRISEDEVKEVIRLSAFSNKLSKLGDQADEYSAMIMEELDPDHLGYIELWQLETLFQGMVASYSKERHLSYSRTLSKTMVPRRWRSPLHRFWEQSKACLVDNRRHAWVLLLWSMAVLGLFTWKFLQYRQRSAFQVMGYCVCTAKGVAETLKLNMALILLPMCRNTITFLRSTFLGSIVPFDDHINFHKVIAGAIVVGVSIHSIVHLTCDFPRLVTSSNETFVRNLGSDFHFHKPSYKDMLESVVGVTGISMVLLMGFSFTLATHAFRRNVVKLPGPLKKMAGFNSFWYSHHLFVVVYALLIVHSFFLFLTHDWRAKTTWIYLSIPVVLYLSERIVRAFRSSRYCVNIIKAAVYPGDVLAIHMAKPPSFEYKSGMYLFVKCPDISPFEWHPFSITSSPGDDFLSIHIRTLGDWTNEMKKRFSKACQSAQQLPTADEVFNVDYLPRFPGLAIDGPYGAPAQNYKHYDILLLIGLGIGATPFISVLRDMLNSMKMEEPFSTSDISQEDQPSNVYSYQSSRDEKRQKHIGPKNAYFYWVTREQGSFEWFKGVMNEVYEYDTQSVIEMHNYLTSVYEEGDARSALITMVQALQNAKNGLDVVSGSRVRTHFARPNWRKVFSNISSRHKGCKIGVFYCGPALLAKELLGLVKEYNQRGSSKFHFHKENF